MRLPGMSYVSFAFGLLLFLLKVPVVYAGEIQGRVVDAQSGEPLAFVNILVDGTRQGTMTDIDGNFSLTWPDNALAIRLSYVGYKSLLHEIDSQIAFHIVRMHRTTLHLAEVVFYAGENPAHRIVKNAMARRRENDPQRLTSFRYNSYNKVMGTLDRDFYLRRWEAFGDSVDYRIADRLGRKDLFMMESVTERKFRYPSLDNEVVIANRVSGMQNPLFTMLATELQPFSFYGNFIVLLEKEYLSPLNSAAFNRYSYHLEDTLYQDRDTVFVVSYRPVDGANFDGLEGLLYIHSHNWALQNVIAEPAGQERGRFRFRIQQQYTLVDSLYWFPTQLNTDIELFTPESLQGAGFPPVSMTGRSYIRNIEINPSLRRRDFGPHTVDFDPAANRAEADFWNQYRTLSQREINTYHYLDSIGQARNFDRMLNAVEPLAFGEIPLGGLSIPVNDIYRYNAYEKHRLGLGLITNRRFSHRVFLGGYYAWGSGDRESKYGYRGAVVLQKRNDIRLGGSYSLDVSERGASRFMEKTYLFSPDYFRSFYTNTMDMSRRSGLNLSFRMLQNFLHTELVASQGKTWWYDAYYFAREDSQTGKREFRFAQAELRLRLAWGETFINTPLRLVQLPGNYPVFHLNITRGFDNVSRGEFDYLKVEGRIDVQYSIPLLGHHYWLLESGWANRSDLPWPLLYTARASNRDGLLASPFSFGNMLINEFVADRYVSLFFRHNFGNLLFRTSWYKPELVLIHNMGMGSLRTSANHYVTHFQGWEKGYFESGVAVNKILPRSWTRSFIYGFSPGMELLYRYGPYSFERNIDNFSAKISLVLSL